MLKYFDTNKVIVVVCCSSSFSMQSIQNLGLAVISQVAGTIVDEKGYLVLEVFFCAWLCSKCIFVDQSCGYCQCNRNSAAQLFMFVFTVKLRYYRHSWDQKKCSYYGVSLLSRLSKKTGCNDECTYFKSGCP